MQQTFSYFDLYLNTANAGHHVYFTNNIIIGFCLQQESINYWLTRFILEVMRADGKPYPANSLYSISTGLLRHFRDDLNRYDIKILSKDDVQFQSFRKALDSRMKAGIGTKKYFSRSSNRMKNSYGHQELLAFIHRKH